MSSSSTLRPTTRYAPVDRIFLRDEVDEVMRSERFFSQSSRVDVFELRQDGGRLLPSLDDDILPKYLSGMSEERSPDVTGRIFFIGGHSLSSDKMNATADAFKLLCDTLSVSSTFISCVSRQQMPGTTTIVDPRSKKPLRHDMWYSMISRLRARPTTADGPHRRESFPIHEASKTVIDWSRMNVWACHDLVNRSFTMLVLRCPDDLTRSVVDTFTGLPGLELLQHPTIMHAYFCSSYLSRSYDFLREFSVAMYDLEKGSKKLDCATKRSQQFLNINREVSQVATDYKILDDAIKMLKSEHTRLQSLFSTATSLSEDDERNSDESAYCFDEALFDQFLSQTEMIKTYSNLYVQRAIIGMNEGFALANQRDAEINIKVAQATYRDSQALKSIQYLTMIFLPPSLAAAIFGMGFFSTSLDDKGQVVFIISKQWWLFLAVAGCLLAIMAIAVFGFRNRWHRRTSENAETIIEEKV